jgi:hypothetical protein
VVKGRTREKKRGRKREGEKEREKKRGRKRGQKRELTNTQHKIICVTYQLNAFARTYT